MANEQGDIIWFELMTSDADAAQAFYGGLIGWTFTNGTASGLDYRLGSSDGTEIVGLMAITPEMQAGGARPLWTTYIGVADIEAALPTHKQLGGTVFMGPDHMESVGHFAFVADPQGAAFYMIQPEGPESQSFAKNAPRIGHGAWNELATNDPEGAVQYYAGLFGWQPDGKMDMGPLGEYHMIRQGDYMIAGIYTKTPEDPQPHWLTYFRVADLDHALEQVVTLGGAIHVAPSEIPGGDFSFVAKDPQGAFFGLLGPMQG